LRVRTLASPAQFAITLAIGFALAASLILGTGPVRAVATGQKVVVIVGPVGGGSIQDLYLSKGEAIAQAAEALGATAVRVFSPNATYATARAAVNGANIIVYIGHGSGYPNPYSANLQPAWNNGWGLNAIAGVDAYDPTGHGHTIGGSHPSMLYCGEAALQGQPKPSFVPASQWCDGGAITPAPGFAMVFSNACYAPGAGETEEVAVTSEAVARQRVEYYSRPFLALGGTYFSSDLGSKSVVENILKNPAMGWGDIYALGNGYSASAQVHYPHSLSSGDEAWLQKTPGPGGLVSWWYAFAGDPNEAPQPTPPIADFTASPTAGIEQLWVGFENDTVTYGSTTWAWDFDNNGTVDSTERNPSWVYPTAGSYSVKLTATNSLGTNTMTKTNHVTVTTPQPSTYFAVAPARLLDTRTGNGLSGAFQARVPRTFQVTGRGGVPAGAVAVTGNLTVTEQSALGYVYLGPNPLPNPPSSTLNFPLNDNRANGVTVAVSPTGTLSATYAASGGSTHLVFDVTGYFMPNTSGATYVPLAPSRLLDTRVGNGLSTPFYPFSPQTFQISGRGDVPTNAVAVTGNLTVTEQNAVGYVYLGPDATTSPSSSTINFPVGDNRANAVTVALSPTGTLSATFGASSGQTQLVFDVTGYFVSGMSGARFVPLTPSRLLDTRFGNGLAGAFSTWTPRSFQVSGRGGVAATALAVTGNMTVTEQTALGYASVGPVEEASPTTSTLNFPLYDNRANGVTVPLGPAGTLSATFGAMGGSTQLIFDVTGYFKP
jgi:PKD repeat protein